MDYPMYDELKDDYILIKVQYPDQIEEIGRLRYLAWKDVEGINKDFFAHGRWLDDYDKLSHLWIIRYKNQIVATARLSIHNKINDIPWHECIPPEAMGLINPPVASINRLSVHPDFRKKGLTRPLDLVRIKVATELKVNAILAEPVLERFNTLEKYGFQHYGYFGSTMELPGVTLGFRMKIL
jgi:predicted GNAT family N-acyltransferase